MITFKTDAYENISYFNEVGKQLLLLMGHSATVPGAFKAEELSGALSRLQKNLGQRPKNTTFPQENEEGEAVIGIAKRAIPLIHLLEAAIKKNADVLWG